MLVCKHRSSERCPCHCEDPISKDDCSLPSWDSQWSTSVSTIGALTSPLHHYEEKSLVFASCESLSGAHMGVCQRNMALEARHWKPDRTEEPQLSLWILVQLFAWFIWTQSLHCGGGMSISFALSYMIRTVTKHVKLAARRPHASFIWPVISFELDMLGVDLDSILTPCHLSASDLTFLTPVSLCENGIIVVHILRAGAKNI